MVRCAYVCSLVYGACGDPMAVRLVYRTYERQDAGAWRLVLEHAFYGADLAEARGYVTSHLEADAFFRGCTEAGTFAGRHGKVICSTRVSVEQVPDEVLTR